MNTYTITFYHLTGDQAEDVDIRAVTVMSHVEADDLAAGDWDAHWNVTTKARDQVGLGEDWDSSHVTLPDGEVAQVPAGL